MIVSGVPLRGFIKKLATKPAHLHTSRRCPTVRDGGLQNHLGVQEIGWVSGLEAIARAFLEDRSAGCDDEACRFNWRPGCICGFRVSRVGSIQARAYD